jgi:hypothetical protein
MPLFHAVPNPGRVGDRETLNSLGLQPYHCPVDLVGGAITILKNINSSMGLSHILWKIKTCLKPPTSNG